MVAEYRWDIWASKDLDLPDIDVDDGEFEFEIVYWSSASDDDMRYWFKKCEEHLAKILDSKLVPLLRKYRKLEYYLDVDHCYFGNPTINLTFYWSDYVSDNRARDAIASVVKWITDNEENLHYDWINESVWESRLTPAEIIYEDVKDEVRIKNVPKEDVAKYIMEEKRWLLITNDEQSVYKLEDMGLKGHEIKDHDGLTDDLEARGFTVIYLNEDTSVAVTPLYEWQAALLRMYADT